jgi:hypothetical protein
VTYARPRVPAQTLIVIYTQVSIPPRTYSLYLERHVLVLVAVSILLCLRNLTTYLGILVTLLCSHK